MPSRPQPSRSSLALALAVVPAVALAGAGALTLSTASDAGAAPGQPLFARTATYPVFQNSGLGVDEEAVAEISAVSPDGATVVYTDAPNGQVGFLDITDPEDPQGMGTLHVGGEPTSVAIRGNDLLVCVDDTDGDFPHPAGRLVVADLAARTIVAEIDLEGQPDSIALTHDGSLAAIAMEDQRDEEAPPDDDPAGEEGDLPQAPAGTLALVDLRGPVAGWDDVDVDLVPALTAAGAYVPVDPEPEYVSFNDQGELALTLQENNAVAVLTPDRTDLAASDVVAFAAGSAVVGGVDVSEDDGTIDPTGRTDDLPREPDAIAWVGEGLVATANEGDLFGGTRGWTVFSTDPGSFGDVVFDSDNTLEHLAIAQGLYPESRSENKGIEPEGIAFAEFDGRPYAFVGSERGNFVAVYDMTDPRQPQYLQTLPTTNGPEGLLPVPQRDLFVVSSETDEPDDDVRASVGLYRLGAGAAQFPTLTSDPADPVAWGALSGLTADPTDPHRLHAVSDSYYGVAAIQTIDTSTTPARVTASLPVSGAATDSFDLEGIAARPAGGWWVVSEGDGDTRPNELVQLSAAGAVVQRVALPAAVAGALGSNGLEGVTVQPGTGPEVVWVALQVPATGDAPDVTRLGRYEVATGTWSWLGYRLEPTPAGAREFVSELVAVDADTFAVIERDNRPGVFASVKRVYTVSIAGLTPAATGAPLPIAPKSPAVDLLPALQATHGWVQEKVEGLAVGGDGQVYAVTDNDGVEDATGETVFLRLGAAATVFAAAAGDGPVVVPTPTPTPTPTPAPGTGLLPVGGGSVGGGSVSGGSVGDWADADGDAYWLDSRSGTGTGSLAYTGTEIGGLLALGGALLAGGTAALLLGRRRTRRG